MLRLSKLTALALALTIPHTTNTSNMHAAKLGYIGLCWHSSHMP